MKTRLQWLLDRLLGLTIVVWGFKAAVKWWDKHPPQRGRRPGWAAWAIYITLRFGLTTSFPGLERRMQWKRRLSRSGVIRYVLFRTIGWTLLRAWGINKKQRRFADPQPPVADSGRLRRLSA